MSFRVQPLKASISGGIYLTQYPTRRESCHFEATDQFDPDIICWGVYFVKPDGTSAWIADCRERIEATVLSAALSLAIETTFG